MPHESSYMLPLETLDRMDDISGSALYTAETNQIEFLTNEQQAAYTQAALNGDEQARNALLTNCLHWTLSKAAFTWMEREPGHSDLMDLVGHANMKMCETMPKALKSSDPMKYLLSVAASEMKQYCTYEDPMVQRPRGTYPPKPVTPTFSLEDSPRLQTTPGPDVRLESAEARERLDSPEYKLVFEALQELTKRRRTILMAIYGLFGHPAMTMTEIAAMLNITKKAVEGDLYSGKKQLAERLAPYVVEKGLQKE
jgi:RNA polymerase sigma factor (sigma-70 family)